MYGATTGARLDADGALEGRCVDVAPLAGLTTSRRW
jgi:hypothetical protein